VALQLEGLANQAPSLGPKMTRGNPGVDALRHLPTHRRHPEVRTHTLPGLLRRICDLEHHERRG